MNEFQCFFHHLWTFCQWRRVQKKLSNFIVLECVIFVTRFSEYFCRSNATVADLICATNEVSKAKFDFDWGKTVLWGIKQKDTDKSSDKLTKIKKPIQKQVHHYFFLRFHHPRKNPRKTSTSSNHQNNHQSPRIVHSGRKIIKIDSKLWTICGLSRDQSRTKSFSWKRLKKGNFSFSSSTIVQFSVWAEWVV